eukprot:461038-Pyramimonas_sp.AAC.2
MAHLAAVQQQQAHGLSENALKELSQLQAQRGRPGQLNEQHPRWRVFIRNSVIYLRGRGAAFSARVACSAARVRAGHRRLQLEASHKAAAEAGGDAAAAMHPFGLLGMVPGLHAQVAAAQHAEAQARAQAAKRAAGTAAAAAAAAE